MLTLSPDHCWWLISAFRHFLNVFSVPATCHALGKPWFIKVSMVPDLENFTEQWERWAVNKWSFKGVCSYKMRPFLWRKETWFQEELITEKPGLVWMEEVQKRKDQAGLLGASDVWTEGWSWVRINSVDDGALNGARRSVRMEGNFPRERNYYMKRPGDLGN